MIIKYKYKQIISNIKRKYLQNKTSISVTKQTDKMLIYKRQTSFVI